MVEKCSKCGKKISIWKTNYVDTKVFCDKCRKEYTGEKINKKRETKKKIILGHYSKENTGGTFGIGVLFLIGSIVYSFFMYSIGYTFIYGFVFGIIGLFLIINSIYKWIKKKMKNRKEGNKSTSFILILLIIIIWIVIIFFIFPKIQDNFFNAYNTNESNPTNSKTNEPTDTNIPKEIIKDQFSNMGEFHWTHMPITYYIVNEKRCGSLEVDRIKKAFVDISNATGGIVTFKKINSSADINFTCSFIKDCYRVVTIGKGIYATSAEEICAHDLGYSRISRIESNKILQAEIERICLYGFKETTPEKESRYGCGYGTCGHRTIEIHEILHSFSFGHNFENSKSIMYPYDTRDYSFAPENLICMGSKKEIDNEIISCLKYIYSNGEIEGNCYGTSLFQSCQKGYVLGQDYECYKECGNGYYCPEDSICENKKCYTYACEEGYYLSNDGFCYPKGMLGNLKFFFHLGQSPELLSVNSIKPLSQMQKQSFHNF